MKIWYDKSKLDLSTFKQEKFLFLPLFDKEVIDRDYNFKNNKWVDVIADQVEYTSMEDAEYFVYHDKFNDGMAEFIKTTQSFNHKPILVFYNDDNSRPISIIYLIMFMFLKHLLLNLNKALMSLRYLHGAQTYYRNLTTVKYAIRSKNQ